MIYDVKTVLKINLIKFHKLTSEKVHILEDKMNFFFSKKKPQNSMKCFFPIAITHTKIQIHIPNLYEKFWG